MTASVMVALPSYLCLLRYCRLIAADRVLGFHAESSIVA